MEAVMLIFTAINCVSGMICAGSAIITTINTYRNQK